MEIRHLLHRNVVVHKPVLTDIKAVGSWMHCFMAVYTILWEEEWLKMWGEIWLSYNGAGTSK